MLKFHQIKVNKDELSLTNVLQAGQAFRWVFNEKENHYTTTMKVTESNKYFIVVLSQPADDLIEFTSPDLSLDPEHLRSHLERYFRLDVSLNNLLLNEWIPKDHRFKTISAHGVRILAQEPWETLISFICSSNNNIARITKMCHSLCTNYGEEVGVFDGQKFFSFPSSDVIAERATETALRDLGFGYRAKYIIETAKKVSKVRADGNYENDTALFRKLQSSFSYIEMREHLMGYTGVGPKVADCVCLMGLGMDDVVPVDVHVSRIAKRDYQIIANNKNISTLKKLYADLPITRKKINLELDHIRLELYNKWGLYAGWAQGVLFSKEVGKVSGATSSGEIKKRAIVQVDIDIKEETATRTTFDRVSNKHRKNIKREQI
ncbi:8-oxoguanine glycosylase OGG1 NDAI_0D04790 [Naumovozyma dairenensis CBS 421]|uniref:DNA-(apurinic or apyrimidinic site) lyase n=1 Tax=Naumovozyma dairenensis (strain ATCC 10597 / BCRC 20456 / CBS 421 / NBRC 0211 / NRRL Y-12639) TaxID=1071378 RepID=G0WAI1_NAUDC|nr:hypothetical protein NDAI_0D04790 [Naumovozyma dairenensis CBS 421]CCD24792.1 hypothetical protein NDAI_0D04790 [Naumovozyma dairenensis CBS 421]